MAKRFREKVLRDPVYGNITIPSQAILDLVDSAEFQRLRRIHQLGMCFTVFHGAENSRFQHALGVMWLMHRILEHWSERRYIKPSSQVIEASVIAALLHDIGHGPFSHALENVFSLTNHESIGVDIIQHRLKDILNKHNIDPNLVTGIMQGTSQEPVFHELLSSQLDVDRMDYLQRDSLFTGAKYGLFDIDRIIYTLKPLLDPHTNKIVCAIDPKGADAVEGYLFSRYYMHWQVYLHRTVRASEVLLRTVLKRALFVYNNPRLGSLYLPTNLEFLFKCDKESATKDSPQSTENLKNGSISEYFLNNYLELDDFDLFHAIKLWCRTEDKILADLSKRFMERKPFKAFDHPGEGKILERIKKYLQSVYGEDWQWYLHYDTPENQGYDLYQPGSGSTPIRVAQEHTKDWREISDVSRTKAISALSEHVKRPLLLIPRECWRHVGKWIEEGKPYQSYFSFYDGM